MPLIDPASVNLPPHMMVAFPFLFLKSLIHLFSPLFSLQILLEKWGYGDVFPPASHLPPLCQQHVALTLLSNLCFECPASFVSVLPRVFVTAVIVMDDPNPLVWQHGGRTICNLIQWISLAKRLDDLEIRKHIRMLNANWQHSRPYWENEDPTRDCMIVPSSHVLGRPFSLYFLPHIY